MIGRQHFVDIIEALEEHENIMNTLIETEVFSIENPLFNFSQVVLNSIADDFTDEAKKDISDIDIGEIIFNYIYEFDFGRKYEDYKGDSKPLIKVNNIEYFPKTAYELYDLIIELTQEEK